MRIVLAFRLFFAALFGSLSAAPARQLLESPEGSPNAAPAPQPAVKPPQAPAVTQRPARSEAITLLAALQREARLVDLAKEPLDDYSDEQIGAAARDVLRDSAKVLDRVFDLQPAVDEAEGATIDLPEGYDAGRYRLTGNVTGTPPHQGQLVHPGWQATRCELPTWSGNEGARLIVAAAEVEVA